MAATARVPVLMTETEKSDLAQRAAEAGLSMGEFLRRAAEAFHPNDDDALLDQMIDQMAKATERAEQAIDETLAFVAESNRRMDELDSRRVHF